MESIKQKRIYLYTLLLMLPVIVLPYLINLLSAFYFLPTLILTIYYIYLCGTLFKSKSKNDNNLLARKIFYILFFISF